MRLNFTFKHLDRSEALENYLKERMEEVGRFLLKDGFGNVYCSKQNHEFCLEISLNTREKYFRAQAIHSDPYQAVDSVVDKIEKQVLKTRKLVQNHRRPELSKSGRLETSLKYKKAA